MPSVEQLAGEAEKPPDGAMISQRVKDVVQVLGDFANLREPERPRSDYLQLLTSDLCSCYGYNADLIDLCAPHGGGAELHDSCRAKAS